MDNAMTDINIAYTIETDKPFAEVAEALETLPPNHSFRVLAVHDVQETLAEKGFERGPLKIVEVCNAGFAHQALTKDADVALFMPCRYTVYEQDGKTIVSLGRPSMIAQLIPGKGLEDLAEKVEQTLKTIMHEAVEKK